MQTICIANLKGGVGKTTTCVNLAGILAYRGKRVLVVDSDPQCNTSMYFADPVRENPIEETIAALFQPEINPRANIVYNTRVPRLDLVIGAFSMTGNIVDIAGYESSYQRLHQFLQRRDIQANYDLCLIDSHPDLGVFTCNALLAATHLLIPVQPERLGLEGIRQLNDGIITINQYRKEIDTPEIQTLGVVITMYDKRVKSHIDWVEIIQDMYLNSILGIIHNASLIKTTSDKGELLVEKKTNHTQRSYQDHVKVAKKILEKITGIRDMVN